MKQWWVGLELFIELSVHLWGSVFELKSSLSLVLYVNCVRYDWYNAAYVVLLVIASIAMYANMSMSVYLCSWGGLKNLHTTQTYR